MHLLREENIRLSLFSGQNRYIDMNKLTLATMLKKDALRIFHMSKIPKAKSL